jgi:two-component system phosphate regulon sensor histidine kinase PhoR
MRLRLRWRVAVAYAVLSVLLLAGLSATLGHYAGEYLVGQLRARLDTECGLVVTALGQSDLPLTTQVRELAAQTQARITVIAADGRVLVDSASDAGQMDLHNTRMEVVDARATGSGWAMRHSATLGVDMLYVARRVGPNGNVVRLAMPATDIRGAERDLRHFILLSALVAAVLAVLLGGVITGSLTGSVEELVRAARRMGDGDLGTRAHVRSTDETADLARALNTMADGLLAARRDLERKAGDLRSVLAQMADGVLIITPDESIRLVNHSAGAMLGTDPDQAAGRRLGEVALDYELTEVARRTLRLRTVVRRQVSLGPEARILSVVATPVEDDQGQTIGAVMTLRDVTDVRRLEQIRRDFVANAGHELRTPVASIRSLAETLAAGAVNDPQASGRFLEQIVQNTETLGRLVDDMMALARLDAIAEPPDAEAVGVLRALQEAADRLAPQTQAKRLEVVIEAPPDLEVWCAEANLMPALVNLLDNAAKYTPEGSRVEMRAEAGDGNVRITVTDQGPGIPEAHRKRVFERFYRVDKSRSRALGGTGLGLSIVKHSVESSGGSVWVESGPDGGARFVVVLPTPPSEAPAAPSPSA